MLGKSKKSFGFKLLILSILCFLVIAFFVNMAITTKTPLPFDTLICSFVYSIRNDFLTSIFTFITFLGNWETIVAICVLLLIFPPIRKKLGLPLSMVTLASSLTNSFLKVIVERPRPDVSLHLVEQGGFSFPSGHSMTSFVFYGFMLFLICTYFDGKLPKQLKPLKFALPLSIFLIGFSRIYLGVHFPTDVLGAWCLGTAFLVFSIYVFKLVVRRQLQKIRTIISQNL